MFGQTQFVGSELGIYGGFGWVQKVFFRIWAWVRPVSDRTGSMFGLFGVVQKGSKFGLSGQTWVQLSSKFIPSSSKQFEVCYIWVRSNTKLEMQIDV